MKLNSVVLKNALKPIIGLAKSNTITPILENLRIKISKGNICLITANQEAMAFTNLYTVRGEEGDYLINAALLNNFLNIVGNKELDFNFENGILTIKYPGGKVKLPYMDGAEFIKSPKVEYGDDIIIQSDSFLEALNKAVKFCVSDDLRVILTGVYMGKSDKGITLAATDAHKLCVIDIEGEFPNLNDVILPKNIINLTHGMSGETIINLSETNIKLRIGNYTFVSRLIGGEYPNFRAIIPNNDNNATIDKNLLSGGVKRMLVTANNMTYQGIFNFKGEELELSSEGVNFSQSMKETIPSKSDLPIKVGFNLKYLVSILSVLEKETVNIYLSEPNKGVTFKEDNTTLILMPVNIQ